MNIQLRNILNLKTRFLLIGDALLAVFFLSIYNRQVCPFINSLKVFDLSLNLIAVLIVQLLFREWLFYCSRPKPHQSLARQGYGISILSWVLAGVFASMLHYVRYPDFPLGSHIKLLSSYWVLGAGILAQLEYIILEQAERKYLENHPTAHEFLERVSRRILEGYFLFTLGPVVVMLLVVFRYQLEGYFSLGVALEVAYIGLFCVVTALLVAIRYGKSLKKDCQTMIHALRLIAQGEFKIQLNVLRSDEFGEMSAGINEMALGLQQRERIQEAFGRFVDPQVAEEFIEKHIRQDQALQLGGERKHLVILMSDIRDFTPLSETMPAEELTLLLNGYFTEMVTAINEHNGMVDKFIGDAVMAIFGLVEGRGNPALDAVKAALAMHERLEKYNQRLKGVTISSGIGIHSGEVVAGYLGSAQRLEFTVIGSPVNIAARIESQAKGSNPRILFSQEIADQIKPEFQTIVVGQSSLKGVSEELTLYSLQS